MVKQNKVKGLGQNNKMNKPLKVMTAGAILAGVVLPAVNSEMVGQDLSSKLGMVHKAEAAELGVVEGFAWFEGTPAGQTQEMYNTYQKGEDFMVMGLEVELKDGATGASLQRVTTDGQGKFAFEPVADGNYLVSFHNPLVWSPVISNITLGNTPDTDSDGPTDILVKVIDGVAHVEAPGEPVDSYISQGFYTGSGALVNSGVSPTITGIKDATGVVNEKITDISLSITDDDKEPAKVTVTGLPDGLSFVPQEPVSSIDANGKITFSQTGIITGTPTKEGTYTVTVSAEDVFGNVTNETMTITVTPPANSVPVLNVTKTDVPYGSTFDINDYASATDADGDTVTITSGAIDTSKPGSQTVTVTADDGKGGVDTEQVTFVIGEKPNEAPVLNVTKTDVPYGSTFDINDYASATDADGDTVTITSGAIDTSKPGSQTVTVTADDGKGGVDTEQVTFVIGEKPNEAPVLTVNDTVVKEGSTFNPMTGVSATDKEDGDLTSKVQVTGTVDTSKPGVYPITYTVTDADGVSDSKTVNVTVELVNVKPVLNVSDVTITSGDTFDPMTGVSATDREDGDITNKVQVTGTVDNNKAGVYTLDYSVTDANGETSTAKRIVTVEAQKQAPRIVVNDEYIMQGSSFDPMDNVWAFDKEDGDITKDVKLVSGAVDTATPGKYDLTYSVTDSDGTTTERTVTIEVGKDHSQAIASLENTVKDLQSQIDGLDKRVTDLEGRVDNIEDKLASLEDRLKSAEERLNALETNDKVQDAKIQELLDKVSTLESQVKELQDKVTVIENQIKDLQAKQAEQEQRLTDLEKKYEELKKQTDANTEDIAKLKEEITKVKEEIASIQDKISQLDERLTNVESQVSTLINKVDALEKKVIELDSRLTTVEQQVSELTNKVTELEKKYTELKSQVDKNTQEIESLKNEIKLIKERIVVLETKVSTLEGKVGNIEKQIKELQTRVNTLEEKVKTLESKPSVIINNNNNNNNNVGGSKVVSGTNSTTPGDVFDNGVKNPNGDPFKNDAKKGGFLPDTGEEKQNVFAIGLGMLLAGMTVIGTKLGLRRKNQ